MILMFYIMQEFFYRYYLLIRYNRAIKYKEINTLYMSVLSAIITTINYKSYATVSLLSQVITKLVTYVGYNGVFTVIMKNFDLCVDECVFEP